MGTDDGSKIGWKPWRAPFVLLRLVACVGCWLAGTVALLVLMAAVLMLVVFLVLGPVELFALALTLPALVLTAPFAIASLCLRGDFLWVAQMWHRVGCKGGAVMDWLLDQNDDWIDHAIALIPEWLFDTAGRLGRGLIP